MEAELQKDIDKGLIHFVNQPNFFWDTVNKKVLEDTLKFSKGIIKVNMFSVDVKENGLEAFLKRHDHQHIIFLKAFDNNVIFSDGRIRVYID